VIADEVTPPLGVALRPISAVRGWGPPPAVLELARWTAWRWAGADAQVLRTATSATAVRNLPPPLSRPWDVMASQLKPLRDPLGNDRDGDPWSSVATDILSTRIGNSHRSPGVASENTGDHTVVVRAPPAYDLLPFVIEFLRACAGLNQASSPSSPMSPMSPWSASSPTQPRFDAGFLILASGNTQAARFAHELRGRGIPVAFLPDEWAAARRGGCVVVGTRAAAFCPLPALSGAVVLDAHDEVYQQEQAPTWLAWQVVAERARREGAPCVLVSACPTLDLLQPLPLQLAHAVPARSVAARSVAASPAPASGTKARVLTLSRALERRGWPPIEVVDRRADDPRSGLFSSRLVTLLRWATEHEGRRVVCILNRTGRVRLLACASCNELARCETCRGPVELVDETLRCRRCAAERPVVCSTCGSGRLKSLRLGVSRVREDLQALLGAPVAELTGGHEADAPVADIDAGTEVVVGTEAALHRLDSADAVAFLDFDAELLAPRLRAGEEALALLARAARLVSSGSGGAPDRARGRILVQTRQPAHEVLHAAVLADPGRLSATELEMRKALDLPPISAMARISGPVAALYAEALREAIDNPTFDRRTLDDLRDAGNVREVESDDKPLNKEGSSLSLQGPVDGVWVLRSKGDRKDWAHGSDEVGGTDRAHRSLCDLLASVPRPAGRLRVEVDPLRA